MCSRRQIALSSYLFWNQPLSTETDTLAKVQECDEEMTFRDVLQLFGKYSHKDKLMPKDHFIV